MKVPFDPYMMLGVSSNASSEDIKKAYRRLSKRLHPDINHNSPGAAAQFQRITAAYELISETMSRRKYDEAAKEKAKNEAEDTYFSMRVTPSKRAILTLPEQQVMYLLTEITPAPPSQEEDEDGELKVKDTHLNLTLVLDRSNSMNGPRLERVKIAAHKIIDDLTEEDYIAVVTFNDRANVIIPSTPVQDKAALKARVSMISASGGTEIYKGLLEGVQQTRQHLHPRLVNHVILLTDGHTFGDQERSLELAAEATQQGISISAMGLGHDWNDAFLDDLAGRTGGSSAFINSPDAVMRFLNDQVRHLSNAFAERLRLSVAPDPDIQLEMAFKLTPHPQPLSIDNEQGYIPLGSLHRKRPVAILLQLLLPAEMPTGYRTIARLVTEGDILQNVSPNYVTLSDLNLEVTDEPRHDEPPAEILDALSKLTLYRLQEKAQEALENGDVVEATRRLENLATRLLELGEDSLARQTLSEAERVAKTSSLSSRGRKTIKYQTRALIQSGSLRQALSSMLMSRELSSNDGFE